MTDLLITMLERLGIIVTVAFILTRFRFFQDLIYQDRLHGKQQLTAILFFGFFGIIGTYFGVTFNTETLDFDRGAMNLGTDEAIANSRVIGIVLAGLLGGYKVGLGAGLIAGIHRFTLGGFTGIACGAASIIAGVVAGAFHRKNKQVALPTAFMVGALAETIQMLIILGVANPFEKAMALVEVIGVPMILANGIGSALFLLIIKNVVSEKEKAVALQAQRTLRIADQTLAHLRKGINSDSAHAVCNILYKEIAPSAVSITDTTNILAHVGRGSDHHQTNSPIQTSVTRLAIHQGELVVADDETIHCVRNDCPLGAAVIAPLKQREETIGTLKFYFHSEKEITNVNMELISGLSSLLSNQLEIAEAERAYQLAKEAEIKALQAQISPHFLFNSLNTIVALVRIDPAKARKLLLSLSHFLRQNLTGTTAARTTLEQELKHVKAYLAIEEARFIDKLRVRYQVEEAALQQSLPPLTLQPLVENAIKHGMKNKEKDCSVDIFIQKKDGGIEISVADNGTGIEPARLEGLGTEPKPSETGTGLGLYNVSRRLVMTFGEQSALKFETEAGKGTGISFLIPSVEVKT